jgi:hypothetical protein
MQMALALVGIDRRIVAMGMPFGIAGEAAAQRMRRGALLGGRKKGPSMVLVAASEKTRKK